jgi:soluble lytic murein transglycosylase
MNLVNKAAVWLPLLAGLSGVAVPTARAWDGPVCGADVEQTSVLACVPVMHTNAGEPSGAAIAYEFVGPPMPDSIRFEPILPATDGGRPRSDSLRHALALASEGKHGEALLALDVVETEFPRIADRVALLRGELLLSLGRPADAVASFETARASIDSAVAARARIGRVRSLMRSDAVGAETAFVELLRYYPELPAASTLRYELAQSKERRGDINGAVRLYRALDLESPGSAVAAHARERIDAIARTGVAVRPLSVEQQVTRLETLVRDGPHAAAREECDRLSGERLGPVHRARVNLMSARIARVEGRFEDAEAILRRGVGAAAQGDEAREAEVERIHDAATAAIARDQELAGRKVDQLRGGRPWRALQPFRLLQIIEVAARAGLSAPVDQALEVLATSRTLHPDIAYQAGLVAAGLGNDARVATLFERAMTPPTPHAVPARYHYARTLERLGRWADAEAAYVRVAADDRSETRWYAMWSEQRLWFVREAMLCDCDPAEMALAAGEDSAEGLALATTDPVIPSRRRAARVEGTRAEEHPVVDVDVTPADVDDVIAKLDVLIERYGDGYPWFARAQDLLRLGETDAAADELHEAYLGWRDARGRPQRNTGIEAVFRGTEAPRRAVTAEARRARREMDFAGAALLAEVCSAVGDEGAAVAMLGPRRAAERPRAYDAIVRSAAERHGLDPNLLLAVMRVESVYQRRIVSYAGAVGLMQIMPRTGRHIAQELGLDDYTTADLLEPRVNLSFAAWYLASLIDRFEGRLPLAIAAYNGGPHNVRRWLEEYGVNMPLDAFLEKIPFEQTHRYVRRVLTHYAAYRAQEGLPMETLGTQLPEVEPDPLAF